jgi:hypothetical protein
MLVVAGLKEVKSFLKRENPSVTYDKLSLYYISKPFPPGLLKPILNIEGFREKIEVKDKDELKSILNLDYPSIIAIVNHD